MRAIKMKSHNQSNELLTRDNTHWQMHYESMKLSKLSRSAYCRQHELNYDRFCYWIRKQKPKTEDHKPLISVRLKPEPIAHRQDIVCTLELKNGHALKIHDTQALALILDRYA